MSLRPRLHDLYVGRTVLASVFTAWAVLLGFDLITAFAQELDEIGEGSYSLSHALLYTLYQIPRRAYGLFPTAAVIGCLMGLGNLAAGSELIALRAAGLSKLRICLGAALALAGVTALMVVNGETLGPLGEQRSQAVAVSAKTKDMIVARFSGTWARDGDVFINVREGVRRGDGLDSRVELADVRLYAFDEAGRLLSITRAVSGELRAVGSVLRNVARTRFGEDGVTQEWHAEEAWDTTLDGESLAASSLRPRYLSTAKLGQTIEYLRRNKLTTAGFEAIYWERWFYPLNVLALCLAAMPFAFGQLRSGGFGKRLFAGIVFGLGFFLLQKLAVNLAEVYGIDLRLAHLLPALTVLGLSWALFRRPA